MFAPFSLEFYLNSTVSIEIQGLSSTDCNFQGHSRPRIFILKFKTFKVRANPESLFISTYSISISLSPKWVGAYSKLGAY